MSEVINNRQFNRPFNARKKIIFSENSAEKWLVEQNFVHSILKKKKRIKQISF
jgi:hypothetical protein